MRSTSLSPPGSSRVASGNGWMPRPSGRMATSVIYVRCHHGMKRGSLPDCRSVSEQSV